MNNKGMTLVEVAVAAALLVLGVIVAMGIFMEGMKSNEFARVKSLATNSAVQQMETIMNDVPANVGNYNGQTFAVAGLAGAGGANPGLITVDNNNPRTVLITVDWVAQGTTPGGHIELRALRSTAQR